VQVFFADGSQTDKVAIEYPLGHRRRREEGIPLLIEKFERNLASRFDPDSCRRILSIFSEPDRLDAMPVDRFINLFL